MIRSTGSRHLGADGPERADWREGRTGAVNVANHGGGGGVTVESRWSQGQGCWLENIQSEAADMLAPAPQQIFWLYHGTHLACLALFWH